MASPRRGRASSALSARRLSAICRPRPPAPAGPIAWPAARTSRRPTASRTSAPTVDRRTACPQAARLPAAAPPGAWPAWTSPRPAGRARPPRPGRDLGGECGQHPLRLLGELVKGDSGGAHHDQPVRVVFRAGGIHTQVSGAGGGGIADRGERHSERLPPARQAARPRSRQARGQRVAAVPEPCHQLVVGEPAAPAAAVSTAAADRSPEATLVTRSTRSCASSTTTMSCSGSTMKFSSASMASSA